MSSTEELNSEILKIWQSTDVASVAIEAYIDHFRGAFTILSGYRTFDQILNEGFAVYDILC